MKLSILLTFFVLQLGLAQAPRPFFSLSDKLPSQNFNQMKLQEGNFMNQDERKSVALATTLSLLLPGMGELYAENYNSGKYFTIAEGALWLTWGSFRTYGNWVRDDARSYAVQHAGITLTNKTDQYFIDIGNFDNVYQFNDQALLDRQNPNDLYNPTSSSKWNWDNDANREQYRQLRVKSDNIHNGANFVIAAIIVNHVASAVNAARSAISHNKAISESNQLDFYASTLGSLTSPNGILVTATYQF